MYSRMKILETHRASIDSLDDRIVDLLVERFEVVRAVGELKASEKIDIVQSDRVEAVKQRVFKRAMDKGLDGDLLRAIYTLIIDHAHTLENRVADKDKT